MIEKDYVYEIEVIDDDLRVMIPFEKLTDDQRLSFLTDLHFKSPDVSGIGKFNETTLSNILVFPPSLDDAIEWGNWLLPRELNEYLDEAAYEKRIEKVSDRFRPEYDLYHHLMSISEMKEFLSNVKGKSENLSMAYWFLNAPTDLTQEEFF